MKFLLVNTRVLQVAVLLWGVPSAAYALADGIVSQVFGWLLAIVVR